MFHLPEQTQLVGQPQLVEQLSLAFTRCSKRRGSSRTRDTSRSKIFFFWMRALNARVVQSAGPIRYPWYDRQTDIRTYHIELSSVHDRHLSCLYFSIWPLPSAFLFPACNNSITLIVTVASYMYMDGSCMLNPVYRRRSFAHVMQNWVEYKILHVWD